MCGTQPPGCYGGSGEAPKRGPTRPDCAQSMGLRIRHGSGGRLLAVPGSDCSDFCRDPGQKASEIENSCLCLQTHMNGPVCNNHHQPQLSEKMACLELLTEGL